MCSTSGDAIAVWEAFINLIAKHNRKHELVNKITLDSVLSTHMKQTGIGSRMRKAQLITLLKHAGVYGIYSIICRTIAQLFEEEWENAKRSVLSTNDDDAAAAAAHSNLEAKQNINQNAPKVVGRSPLLIRMETRSSTKKYKAATRASLQHNKTSNTEEDEKKEEHKKKKKRTKKQTNKTESGSDDSTTNKSGDKGENDKDAKDGALKSKKDREEEEEKEEEEETKNTTRLVHLEDWHDVWCLTKKLLKNAQPNEILFSVDYDGTLDARGTSPLTLDKTLAQMTAEAYQTNLLAREFLKFLDDMKIPWFVNTAARLPSRPLAEMYVSDDAALGRVHKTCSPYFSFPGIDGSDGLKTRSEIKLKSTTTTTTTTTTTSKPTRRPSTTTTTPPPPPKIDRSKTTHSGCVFSTGWSKEKTIAYAIKLLVVPPKIVVHLDDLAINMRRLACDVELTTRYKLVLAYFPTPESVGNTYLSSSSSSSYSSCAYSEDVQWLKRNVVAIDLHPALA